ncbi:hypothetical protein CMV_007128 [Castanea mollissima]|uniref:Uncharacterized protein n=1 Tax=Castanea mollissima TaxID=60419 RepID=A0A8J4RML7_9ROSI|nr:hypothetical protein CMV_007128 [Castanea mollissima]
MKVPEIKGKGCRLLRALKVILSTNFHEMRGQKCSRIRALEVKCISNLRALKIILSTNFHEMRGQKCSRMGALEVKCISNPRYHSGSSTYTIYKMLQVVKADTILGSFKDI